MTSQETRVYLIHVEMPGAGRRRLQKTVHALHAALWRLGSFERLYNSPRADLVGFMLQTTRRAGQIRVAIEEGDGAGSATRAGDKFMILEIGDDYFWQGFGAIDPFLRRTEGNGPR